MDRDDMTFWAARRARIVDSYSLVARGGRGRACGQRTPRRICWTYKQAELRVATRKSQYPILVFTYCGDEACQATRLLIVVVSVLVVLVVSGGQRQLALTGRCRLRS